MSIDVAGTPVTTKGVRGDEVELLVEAHITSRRYVPGEMFGTTNVYASTPPVGVSGVDGNELSMGPSPRW
jgi:hypothetical protein